MGTSVNQTLNMIIIQVCQLTAEAISLRSETETILKTIFLSGLEMKKVGVPVLVTDCNISVAKWK